MEKSIKEYKYTNELIRESSPYLLQHAHNPVNWQAWNDKTLQKAKDEDKIMLVSIGYSACHWCHVMEHESFEDEEVAAYMNAHFVCIKVDREERPDVDQVYMNAVQLISGRGGWPLNCFALPDGRPFFGGTYFPKKNWLYLLQNVVKEYENERSKVEEYADELTKGIQRSELITVNNDQVDNRKLLSETVEKWKSHFDNVEGGPDRAPKFPLPNNYQFLMDYAFFTEDEAIMSHVKLTLDKMAMGGIYDQIGGGFARYSTDALWKVPHFEKMLYDNAQLISLYAKAYQHFKDPLYKKVIEQSLAFVERELSGPDAEFYSALDADSEGEEGKFYVWNDAELQHIEGLDFDFVASYYSIEEREKWEGNYILQRKKKDEKVMKEFDLSATDLASKVSKQASVLMKIRDKRVRPGLDDKSLTSWNALMVSAYVDAYRALGDRTYLERAIKSANFIIDRQLQESGELMHNYKAGQSSISGFLEDYASTAKALIDLYQVTFNNEWIKQAEKICAYTIDNFMDRQNHMFYFTPISQKDLVARKMEVTDNVIPASNSIMATVLFELGLMLDHTEWSDISAQMLQNVSPYISNYGSSYSNWASLMLKNTFPFYEVAVLGSACFELTGELQGHYLPNTLFVGSINDGRLPLLENKYVKGKNLIYVCVNKACQLPVQTSEEAMAQISYTR